MSSANEMCIETLRMGARTAKAIALQKYRAGDLAGAKVYAHQAKELNPVLTGLHRLNAVLDLLLGSEKRIHGEVDWYAVLGVDPTADTATIQRRNRKLLLSIVMDDGDDSVGGIERAKHLVARSHRFLCDENNRRLYDKRRQERADQEMQQQLMRASQGSSFTGAPVVLSAPNPPQRVSEENERMVQPSSRMFGQVPVTLSGPPQRSMMSNGETETMFEVKVGQHSQLPSRISLHDLRRATQVPSSSSSALGPVVQSQRQKVFNEEDEEVVEVSVEEFSQALLPSSSRGGENKRKAPMSLLQANQSRKISEDAGIKSIEGRRDYVVPSVTKPSLEGYVSASQYVNVASSPATRAHQESNKGNAVYASHQHVNIASSSALIVPQESNKFSAVSASHQHVNIGSSSAPKAPQEYNKDNAVYASRQHVTSSPKASQESNMGNAVYASRQHVPSAPKASQESNMGNAVYASRQHVTSASKAPQESNMGNAVYASRQHVPSAPKAPQESNMGNVIYASRQHVPSSSSSAPKAPQESNMGNAVYASRQHVSISSSSAPKAPQESNMGNAVYASGQHVNIVSSSAPTAPQESNMGNAVYASGQHVNIASSSVTRAPQESNMGNAVYASQQHVNVASSSPPKAPQETNIGNAFYASRQHVNITSSSAPKVPQESNMGNAVYAPRQHVNIASSSAPKAPQESNMGNAENRVNIGNKYIFNVDKQAYEKVYEIEDEKKN